jgi:hypothetical protein
VTPGHEATQRLHEPLCLCAPPAIGGTGVVQNKKAPENSGACIKRLIRNYASFASAFVSAAGASGVVVSAFFLAPPLLLVFLAVSFSSPFPLP